VPAGLLDSSLSSLATFAIGLFAIHLFTTAELGAYALFFTAFLLAAVVPAMAVFTPLEVGAVGRLDERRRPAVLRRSLRLGVPVAALAAAVICLGTLFVPTGVPLKTRLAFAVTATVLAAISPVQDHVRRVFHQSGRSWDAAHMSAIQVGVVVILLVAMQHEGVSRAWVPFSALALANLISLVVGRTLARSAGAPKLQASVPAVLRRGGWLFGGGVIRWIAAYAAIAIVTASAGANPAGFAEAARVLAQPVTVLAIGILSVFNSELVTAAQRQQRSRLHRLALVYIAAIGLACLAWIAVVTPRWSFSPLPHLFAKAYVIGGLLPLVVLAETSGYAALGYGTALIGGRRERATAVRDVLAAIATVAVTALTTSHGAFALVWGGLAGAVVTYVVNALALRAMLRQSAVQPSRNDRPQSGSEPKTDDRARPDADSTRAAMTVRRLRKAHPDQPENRRPAAPAIPPPSPSPDAAALVVHGNRKPGGIRITTRRTRGKGAV
jgi:hypothetical protein